MTRKGSISLHVLQSGTPLLYLSVALLLTENLLTSKYFVGDKGQKVPLHVQLVVVSIQFFVFW